MLSLTRRVGETLIIGEDIEIRVVEFFGGQVRLGIRASQDVEIWREELLDRGGTQAEPESHHSRPSRVA